MAIRVLDALGIAAVIVLVCCGLPLVYVCVPMPSRDEMRDWR